MVFHKDTRIIGFENEILVSKDLSVTVIKTLGKVLQTIAKLKKVW